MSFLKFLKQPLPAAVLGFLSVYAVWAAPAFIWGWSEWFSLAYKYGDHIVLPLFNAISFWLVAHIKERIPLRVILLSSLVIVPGSVLIVFFEPDASAAREAGTIGFNLSAWHGVFIFFEFSFILFMCGVYPFLKQAYAHFAAITALFLLIECFLLLVFVGDSSLHSFLLWQKILPGTLLALAYGVVFINWKWRIIKPAR